MYYFSLHPPPPGVKSEPYFTASSILVAKVMKAKLEFQSAAPRTRVGINSLNLILLHFHLSQWSSQKCCLGFSILFDFVSEFNFFSFP